MIKAIVFDFNGVFATAPELGILGRICAIKKTAKWAALSNYYLNLQKFELGYFSPFYFWKRVFPSLTQQEYAVLVEAEHEKPVQKNQWLYELCAGLSEKYGLYCLSNSNFLQSKSYRKQGLYSAFNAVFLSHETGKLKPSPGTFAHFLGKTGLKAEECIYLDDKQLNVLAAVIIGFKGIAYMGNDSLKQRLTELGVGVEYNNKKYK